MSPHIAEAYKNERPRSWKLTAKRKDVLDRWKIIKIDALKSLREEAALFECVCRKARTETVEGIIESLGSVDGLRVGFGKREVVLGIERGNEALELIVFLNRTCGNVG